MAGRQAKTIAPIQLDALLQHVRGPKMYCGVVSLSFYPSEQA
jgi:hypothetical protein